MAGGGLSRRKGAPSTPRPACVSPPDRCAVALDAWMFPLENTLYPKVAKPVLFVNTESFQTADSIAKMKRIIATSNESKIITIL